ncbi:MAG: FAD-dependent oxidoreductase [Mogibacterium sp.]|nr:FAD-dependent oxidoreductase [Mogibacterium sp.]
MSSVRGLHTDILVIGGGAAGMAAAAGAAAAGASVLLADERPVLGGVLPQCIHQGFGLGYYNQDLTGPEYCAREEARFLASGASYLPSARVTELRPDRTALLSSPEGLCECSFDQCVLATGCRERPLSSLGVAGTRPSGIYTAGEAQELLNLGHYDIGSRVVILGSGDIGQIMARRLVLTGRTVVAMAEIKGSLGGMKRNHEECIRAYHIPVIFHATVTAVHGYPALTAVTLHHLDTGADETVPCDTLITALGLIPETSLAEPLRSGDGYPAWLHLCGNADHIHEIVDSVTTEALRLGRSLVKSH